VVNFPQAFKDMAAFGREVVGDFHERVPSASVREARNAVLVISVA